MYLATNCLTELLRPNSDYRWDKTVYLLLTKGICIVNPFEYGKISEFITEQVIEEGVNCVGLTLDPSFFESELLKETLKKEAESLDEEITALSERKRELLDHWSMY